jgi:hypothetical protein
MFLTGLELCRLSNILSADCADFALVESMVDQAFFLIRRLPPIDADYIGIRLENRSLFRKISGNLR